jgi:hypothetical protein
MDTANVVVQLDIAALARLFYLVGGGVLALLGILVGFAWRAGGDVREIKLAILNHGPRIDEAEDKLDDHSNRLVRLETLVPRK